MRKCDNCGKVVSINYYDSDYNTILCEVCGDELLAYNDSIDCYVYEEDNKETFYDDEISDVEMFDFEQRHELDEIHEEDELIEFDDD